MSYKLIALLWIFGLLCISSQAGDLKSYRYDYPGSNSSIASARATHDNGIVVTGFNWSDAFFISAFDSTGAILFSNLYTCPFEVKSHDIVQTYDGGYALLGEIEHDDDEILIFKTDSAGNPLWARHYYFSFNRIISARFIQGLDSSLYVINHGGGEGLKILKVDANGSFLWHKSYSPINWAFNLTQRPNGNLVVMGNQMISDTLVIVVAELNENGNVLWRKNYAPDKETMALGFSFTQEGGMIITGNKGETFVHDDELFLLSLNDTGKVEWCKSICDTVMKRGDVTLELSDGYLVGGYTFLKKTGRHVNLITKFSKTGDFLWSRINGLDETFYGDVNGLVRTSDGLIHIISSSAYLNIYKTDENFENFCGYEYRDHHAYNIEVVTTTGTLSFTSSPLYDSLITLTVSPYMPEPALLCANPYSSYTGDVYVSPVILHCPEDVTNSVVQPVMRSNTDYLLYPQPAQNHITLQTEGKPIQEVMIFSTDGYLITDIKNIHASTITIPTGTYPNGAYILKAILINGGVIVEKVIVAKP